MSCGLDSQQSTWRVLALRANGSEFLAIEAQDGLSLPSVAIRRGFRTVQELNAQILALWNLDVFSLGPLGMEASSNGHPSYPVHVVEIVRDDSLMPTSARWLRTSSVSGAGFLSPADVQTVRLWGREMMHLDNSAPLGRPGCLAALRTWVTDALEPIGLHLGSQFLQLSASRSFSLVRFETDSRPVWFKAVGEPNTREFALTVLLSKSFPAFMPELLAVEARWNAWLAAEVPGPQLSDQKNTEAWSETARDLAALQIASVPLTEQLLDRGARDVRCPALCGRVTPFFAMLRDLMERQANPAPSPLSFADLDQLASRTCEALSRLHEDGVPDSLGHLDLNAGNIIARNGATVILDWAEACVGHPFFTFAYLLEYLRRTGHTSAATFSKLIRAYAKAWESRGDSQLLAKSLGLAIFLAVFVHAASTEPWRNPDRLVEPHTAGYYRSLARRMHLYASRIHAGAADPLEVWA